MSFVEFLVSEVKKFRLQAKKKTLIEFRISDLAMSNFDNNNYYNTNTITRMSNDNST